MVERGWKGLYCPGVESARLDAALGVDLPWGPRICEPAVDALADYMVDTEGFGSGSLDLRRQMARVVARRYVAVVTPVLRSEWNVAD